MGVTETLCSFRLVLDEKIGQEIPKVPRAKFLGNDGLFCFISTCKFGSFKNPFATITSLPELYFRFRRFIFLVQMKKMISMNYVSSTSSWKPRIWVRLHLTLSMSDKYINSKLNPLTKFTSSCRGTEFKEILPWNISPNDQDDRPIQQENSHKQCDETGHPIINMMESQWKLRQRHDQNFPMEGNNQKKEINAIEQAGIQVGKLAIRVRSFETEKL